VTVQREPAAAELIVYVDHADIDEGRLDEVKEGIRRLVESSRPASPN